MTLQIKIRGECYRVYTPVILTVELSQSGGSILQYVIFSCYNCDPVTCAVHAKEHGLLNKPGWKQFKKFACEAKTLQHLVNNAKQAQRFGQIVYKFGVHIP